MGLLLYCARHAETAWSLSGQHTGKTDLPLTPHGKKQGVFLKQALQDEVFETVFCSPLRRAKETCTFSHQDKNVIIDPDLVEWDYGDFEGKTWAEIQCIHPGWDLFIDGAPGGETVEDVIVRADRFLARVEHYPRDGDEKILLFSSGHILRVIMMRWLGLPMLYGHLFSLETASITVLGFERGRRTLKMLSVTKSLA